MVFVHALVFIVGVAVVVWVLMTAIRTFVVPRSVPIVLTQAVFVNLRRAFNLVMRNVDSFETRDGLMALYPALGLLLLPVVWWVVMFVAFTFIFWAIDIGSWRGAVYESGSSITTLGSVAPSSFGAHLIAFFEAFIGLGVLALLISYLPSIYSTFQRRELKVALLETRAGQPPSAVKWIVRHQRISWLEGTSYGFDEWEQWFADIEESHTSLPALAFFRSPLANRSWITAAGTVLDGAALLVSTVEGPRFPEAQVCIRAGYLCLRRIAEVFGITYDPDPRPDDPISIHRSEFDAAVQKLRAADVPLKADLDQAWRDFQGWRVNYDRVLLTLAGVVMAPPAPWTSDRSLYFRYERRFSPIGVLRSVHQARVRAREEPPSE